jgi:magnesium-transporting ATPase (P-type)
MSTEAMLTGESTPQRKHAMDVAKSAGNKVGLDDVNTIDKTHVLFAGTRVLRAEFNPGAGVKVGKPPDKGLRLRCCSHRVRHDAG